MRWRGPCRPRRSGSASCPVPRRRAPPASARYPREPPVSRPFPRPGVALGWCPFPTVKAFLPATASIAQEPAVIHFEFFRCPHVAHRTRMVIRTPHWLSTGLCTNHPQVTWRSSGNTGAGGMLNRSAFSRQWPVTVLGPGARRQARPGLTAWCGCGNVHTLGCRLPHPPPSAKPDAGRRAAGDGGPGCVLVPPAAWVHHAPVNPIARRRETTYHGCMTTLQAPKRAGYMNPISQLKAALMGGMVAV
jgi:hypothetical protein